MNNTQNNRTPIIIGAVLVVALIVGGITYAIFMNNDNKDNDTAMSKDNDTAMSSSSSSSSSMMSSSSSEELSYVGGAAMYPNKNIVENVVNAPNLTTAVAAIQAAGLVETLQAPGPFTVFGPTNDAFTKLPAGTVDTLLKPENKTQLVGVLTYHVVAGRILAADLKDGQELTTVNGAKLRVKKTGSTIMINDAKVETADVLQSNGVAHVIDTVLLPPATSSASSN